MPPPTTPCDPFTVRPRGRSRRGEGTPPYAYVVAVSKHFVVLRQLLCAERIAAGDGIFSLLPDKFEFRQ